VTPKATAPRSRSRRLGLAGIGAASALALAACSSSSTKPAATPPSASSAGTSSSASAPGAFAASHFTTNLAGICPNPLVVQTNWLPEPDHGALYELIGGGGSLHQYSYSGPLGSTGIKMEILAGGPGDGNLSMPTVLYSGNPVARVTPDLAMGSPDTAMQLSAKFPVVAVVSLQEHDPLSLIYDPTKFHDLNSIPALIAAAKQGAHFYVSSLQTTYVPFLISRGVPQSAFISGYEGDLGKFVAGDGMIINQGYADSEVINLEHFTPNWDKPVAYTLIYKLGLNDYDEAIEVPKPKLASMSACLSKLVPMVQQAEVDYIEHPAEVNNLLNRYNSGGFGASYWQTPLGYSTNADKILIQDDLVGNSDGGNGPVGGFNMDRLAQNISILLPIYAKEGVSTFQSGLVPSDIATNQFIDNQIKMPSGM